MEKGCRGWKRITLLPELYCMGEPTLFIDFLTKRSEPFPWLAPPGQLQWRIQGRAPRAPPYFSTKMRPEGPKKIFWETAPPPPHLRVWMTPPPLPLSEGLDPPLNSFKMKKSRECTGAGLDNQTFSIGYWLRQRGQCFAHVNARLS